MKLIVSAYVAGATSHDNAVATMNLLSVAAAYSMRLVQGVYLGESETSVEMTGFPNVKALHKTAERLCKAFGQEVVYYEVGGIASLLYKDGTHLTLGTETKYPAGLVRSPIFRSMHQNYTVYSDGSAIVAPSPNFLKEAA